MNRIMIIGVSAGVGKSTFASTLGNTLQIPVYHLDSYFWKSGWVEATLEEFTEAQKLLVQEQKWIIEGNYLQTIYLRELFCDTVIYLELPLHICLYRVVKRYLSNLGQTRPDMPVGCTEKLDWKFIKFIVSTYYSRREKMKEKLLQYQSIGKQVIVLKSKQEIEAFLLRSINLNDQYGNGR